MASMSNQKFKSADEYMASLTDEAREVLLEMKALIKQAAPNAVETFSYQMPAFKYKGMLAYYAETANHWGLYLSPHVITLFKDRLKGIDCSKAAVRLPKGQPLPHQLIIDLVKMAVVENEANDLLKQEKKRRKK